jgi:hypothetical protein
MRRVVAITLLGEKMTLSMDLVGLSSYAFGRLYLSSMSRGDLSAAQQLADRLNLGREDPFVEFRLESETYMVTDAGVVKADNPVITHRVVY